MLTLNREGDSNHLKMCGKMKKWIWKFVNGIRKIGLFVLKLCRVLYIEREQYMETPELRGRKSVVGLNNFSRVGTKN